MKSLNMLWSCTAEELAVRCRTSAARDIKTVTSRTKHEGLSFLAITLADYGKVIQKWLNRGLVDPSEASSFKKGKGSHTGLPAFLSGFLGRVFDPASGALLDQPDIECIYAVRQLTLMFSKIALPEVTRNGQLVSSPVKRSSTGANRSIVVSPNRERAALSEYVQIEHDVRASDARIGPEEIQDFTRMSEMLFSELFSHLDLDIQHEQLVPQHGPGVVADRLSSNEKWDLRSWPARLQSVMPAGEYLFPNWRWFAREGSDLNIVEPGQEQPVRVVVVPKTLKTPRVIAIEPTAMMFAQKAIFGKILDLIQEDDFLHQVVGFKDQEPNRLLAQKGSYDGSLATLDLSEASDRVSNQLVRAMTLNYPHLYEAVQGSRSRKADVPGHGVIRLSKFASMGSALCFPFEAFVFLTLIFLGIERELDAPLSRKEIVRLFSEQVRVFGDDLIVPRKHVLSVINELELFGAKVNIGKSFWTGRFRESCGREYYDGTDVSITKVRQVLPTSRQDANGVISAVKFRNRAYWAGLWQTAKWMDDYLGKLLKAYPTVAPTSPLLGRESALGYEFLRLDPFNHSPLIKGYKVVAKPPPDHLEGSGALLKCLSKDPPIDIDLANAGFMKIREIPLDAESVDDEHLERSGRPKRVSIKLGWSSPY